MSNIGHNSGVSAARLLGFVTRIERIDDEIAERNQDKSEIYQEAKGEGWDLPALKALIAERRKKAKDPQKFAEKNSFLDLYRATLEGIDNPAEMRHAQVRVREAE